MNLNFAYYKAKSILGLSLSLAKVKFKLRNEGSYLGVFWYLLSPLAMFLILLSLRGLTNKNPIEYYPIYLLLGLIVFNLFRYATTISTNAIRVNAGLIKSLKINLEPFVISGIMQAVFSHIFEVIILVLFLFYFKVSLLCILFYPVVLFFLIIFIIGVSFILSTIGTYINDIENVWNIFLNLLWFSTPIFYSTSKDIFINKINPMYYFILGAREIIIYNKLPDFKIFLIMAVFSFGFLAVGLFVFEKYKKSFAEFI